MQNNICEDVWIVFQMQQFFQGGEKSEIILIDDGSIDDSSRICNELAEKNREIKVFHISNQGVSKARNYGIENSRG